MQQIYRRTPMSKCDFNKVAIKVSIKVAKQLYSNRTSAWVFSCKLLHIFRTPFPRSNSGWLLLCIGTIKDINKKLDKNLLELFFWLNTNKIALNAELKTQVLIFKTKYKILNTEVKLKLCRKQVHFKYKSIKHLGVRIDELILERYC